MQMPRPDVTLNGACDVAPTEVHDAPKPYGIFENRCDGLQVGWNVRIRRRGNRIDRTFAASTHGGLDGALQAALAFRDQVNREVAPLSRREQCATLRSSNTSGVPGVYRVIDGAGQFWKAQLRFADGHVKSRQFSINKYGEAEAFRRAVEARLQLLAMVEGMALRHPDLSALAELAPDDWSGTVRQPAYVEPTANPYAPAQACGIPGIHLINLKTTRKNGDAYVTRYWTCNLKKPSGLPKRRYFSVTRYGEEKALRLAIEQLRAWEIEQDPPR